MANNNNNLLEANFTDVALFSSHYQRNNKRGSVKNLRCFPSCSALHKQRGFCGRSVVMQVRTHNPGRLYTFCEFLKQDEPRARNVGHTVSLQECEMLTRSKTEPLKPWVRGALTSNEHDGEEAVFEFNQEKRGWHYGWASNKHTCNSNHVLVAYILEPTAQDSSILRILALVESPPFMLFCRRRRRFTIVPKAPISEIKPSSRPTAAAVAAAAAAAAAEDSDEEDDEEEDEDDDDVPPPPPPPPPPPKRAAAKKKTAAETKTNKRAKTAAPTFPVAQIVLDKNRVDALLTLLHMAWRKMKEVPTATAPGTPMGAGNTSMLYTAPDSFASLMEEKLPEGDPYFQQQTTLTMSDFASEINADELLIDYGIYSVLDFLVGNDVDSSGGGGVHLSNNRSSFNEFDMETSYPYGVVVAQPPPPLPPLAPSSSDTHSECEEWSNPDIEELATYLLDAKDFRESIAWLRGQGASPDFSAFLGVLRDHIQLFMKLKQWTVTDVDRIIQTEQQPLSIKLEVSSPPSWMVGGGTFSWNLAAASAAAPAAAAENPGTPRHFYLLADQRTLAEYETDQTTRIPNITGVWSQTAESKAEMERVRERTGSSWVMSKLFEFMESKFTVQQHGNELSCRMWPMPALKFILDGEERAWGIRLPLFQPNWTYRAWTDGDVIHLQHQIENRRLTRKYWCDDERQNLYSEATLEVYDMQLRKFKEESRVVQVAERAS